MVWASRKIFLIAAVYAAGSLVFALPTHQETIKGNIELTASGNTLNITQNTNTAIINWHDFNIAANETVKFNQAQSALAINNVTSGDISQILGALKADGKIILINPAGIAIGKSATIDTRGFIATTATVDNYKDLSKLRFIQTDQIGKIENHGTITAKDGGLVALISPIVANHGTIKTINAIVGLYSSFNQNQFFVDFTGDGLINFEINNNNNLINDTADYLINNTGKIIGRKVVLSIPAATAMLNNTFNIKGDIEANRIELNNGKISLVGNSLHNLALTNATQRVKRTLAREFANNKKKFNKLDKPAKDFITELNNTALALYEAAKNQNVANTETDKLEQVNAELAENLQIKVKALIKKGYSANRKEVSELISKLNDLQREVQSARRSCERANKQVANLLELKQQKADLEEKITTIKKTWLESNTNYQKANQALELYNKAIEQMQDVIDNIPKPIAEITSINIPGAPPPPPPPPKSKLSRNSNNNIRIKKQSTNNQTQKHQIIDTQSMSDVLSELLSRTNYVEAYEPTINDDTSAKITAVTNTNLKTAITEIAENITSINNMFNESVTKTIAAKDSLKKAATAFEEFEAAINARGNRARNRVNSGRANIAAMMQQIREHQSANRECALAKLESNMANRQSSTNELQNAILNIKLRDSKAPRPVRTKPLNIPKRPSNTEKLKTWETNLTKEKKSATLDIFIEDIKPSQQFNLQDFEFIAIDNLTPEKSISFEFPEAQNLSTNLNNTYMPLPNPQLIPAATAMPSSLIKTISSAPTSENNILLPQEQINNNEIINNMSDAPNDSINIVNSFNYINSSNTNLSRYNNHIDKEDSNNYLPLISIYLNEAL